MRPICLGAVSSQIMFRPLRGIVVMSATAAGLLSAWGAFADQRDVALDAAIPAAMQKASVPGAIVGIWQDGHAPYVRTFGERNVATRKPMAPDLYMRIPRLLQNAGRHGRRRNGLESVVGLGFGQHDLDARGYARMGPRLRSG